jgi:hypothetical protein
MPNGNNEDIGNKIDDVMSYPILTEEVRHPGPYRSTPNVPADTTQYGKVVETALRDILGWRVKNNDPKGFVAALNQSFHLADVEGHTEWRWMPHTYAIDAELGAVTGAQAALYARAKAAINQALPLLNGLKTLLPASDEQDVEAMSAIIRSSLTELVSELGEEGGPILSRVDQYFEQLLGQDPNANLKDSEQVGGQLGRLRDAFGLVRKNVNTIAEEQDLTNFLILVDYVNSLKLTWNAQKHFFDRQGTDVFLGTQLVLLSRTLAVVAESVQEAYFAMDSVFLGPAERRVTKLNLGKGPPIFIGELLSWVERFALEEGPRLLKEAGKEGIIQAFSPTVAKLNNLVEAAAEVAGDDSTNPTPGFHTPRVQRAFEELSAHLNTTLRLASTIRRVPRPSITEVTPEKVFSGDTVQLIINGTDFQLGAKVRLKRKGQADDDEIQPSKVLFVHQAEIKATFKPDDDNVGNDWTLVVINPDGQYDSLRQAVSINSAPAEPLPPPPQASINTFVPSRLPNLRDQELTITGENLDPDYIIVTLIDEKFESSPFIMGKTMSSSSTNIVAMFDLSNAPFTTDVRVKVDNLASDGTSYTLVAPEKLEIYKPYGGSSGAASGAKRRRKK